MNAVRRAIPDAVERAVDCRNILGEGPLWCPIERVLWWIDISGPALWRFDPASGAQAHWPLPKLVGSLCLRRDGGLLIAFRAGLATLDSALASLDSGLARPEQSAESVRFAEVPDVDFNVLRFNDGKTDRAGRFWVGAMDRKLSAPIGGLYRIEANLRPVRVDGGFVTIANGIGWSPDNRTMYFTDTPSRRIYAYDFDLASGAVANRRVFVEVEPGHGGPDGLTVDAEGGVWSVQFDRWCIHRYAPDGSLERVLTLPVQRPTSVMFGGVDLDTLYITTATMDLDAQALAAQPLAGAVLAVQPGVKGLPEARFAG